ncbi:RING-H2 finger protein ATL80-like [Sesamum indicum]|uniref:RING-H2 finger protein ATL80-like n=1 Tax=Sesamum indicum TaxID=4182 RepID=A0A6I9TKD6_SESIN|nr:RING-H2 finger protein ATL80-like [Sesamum indicum]
MGFLYLAIRIPRAISIITFFANIFTHARFLFIGTLAQLGLYKPPPEEEPNSRDNSENYILILDGSSPSLVPIPVNVVTAAIKKRVPRVQFQDFIRRRQGGEEEELSELIVCSICLECIEWCDEIRELCNCSHVFHSGCLDTWLDEGQVTCPLCRSMLLTPRTILTSCNENRDGLPQNDAHLVDN